MTAVDIDDALRERHPVDGASLGTGCLLGWLAGVATVGVWVLIASHLAVIWHG